MHGVCCCGIPAQGDIRAEADGSYLPQFCFGERCQPCPLSFDLEEGRVVSDRVVADPKPVLTTTVIRSHQEAKHNKYTDVRLQQVAVHQRTWSAQDMSSALGVARGDDIGASSREPVVRHNYDSA